MNGIQANALAEARQEFEDATWAYYRKIKAAGWSSPDEGDSSRRESIFWRHDNGMYGVQQIEAAWCGWQLAKGLM